jgi:hypothetical protein
VTASKDGYQSQTESASVTGGETTAVNFALAPITSGGGEAGTVSVTSISYSGHGGPAGNRHLTVTVWVADENERGGLGCVGVDHVAERDNRRLVERVRDDGYQRKRRLHHEQCAERHVRDDGDERQRFGSDVGRCHAG